VIEGAVYFRDQTLYFSVDKHKLILPITSFIRAFYIFELLLQRSRQKFGCFAYIKISDSINTVTLQIIFVNRLKKQAVGMQEYGKKRRRCAA
jgi:hypothetical protein